MKLTHSSLTLFTGFLSVLGRSEHALKCDETEFLWNEPSESETAYAVQLHTDNAACLDGSPPVIYVRKGTNEEDAKKFVFFFQGGGWCSHLEGEGIGCEQTCLHRSKTDHGSSLEYEPYASLKGEIWGSFRETWTQVYYRYCDGSSWTSNIETPVTVYDPDTQSSVNLYFRGFNNIKAMLTELTNAFDLASATEILVSGCSAGGLATYLHGDWIIDEVAKIAPNLERTGLVPNSGYFMEYESDEQKYVSAMKWVYSNNATESLPDDCLAFHRFQPWKCMFSPNVAPFMKNRLFPIQSQYDTYQSRCILGSDEIAAMNAYGHNLSLSMIETVIENDDSQGSGAFLDSCSHHCLEWNKIIIDDLNYDQALEKWFYSEYPYTNGNFHFQNRDYPCAECC